MDPIFFKSNHDFLIICKNDAHISLSFRISKYLFPMKVIDGVNFKRRPWRRAF